jgi:uncharacterized protein YbjQ (UPF0145 family)
MAECDGCGKSIGFLENRVDGLCTQCNYLKSLPAGEVARANEADRLWGKEQEAINSIMLTTETAPNLNITERIEIVTAECAFGMHIFKDLFAGVRDIVGGRSEAVQQTMRDSRKTALYELKKEAYEVGANAVVGVDLDYVELSKAGSMVMLVASGTAVRIEK